MLEKFGRDIFVDVIFPGQLDGHAHQVETKHSHPAGGVTLLEMTSVWKPCASVEHADVIETKKTALENIVTLRVFAIHPPGESEKHFVKNCLQKCAVAFAGLLPLDLVDPPGGPGQHRRIHIAEIPFVSGNLSVRVLIPFA